MDVIISELSAMWHMGSVSDKLLMILVVGGLLLTLVYLLKDHVTALIISAVGLLINGAILVGGGLLAILTGLACFLGWALGPIFERIGTWRINRHMRKMVAKDLAKREAAEDLRAGRLY